MLKLENAHALIVGISNYHDINPLPLTTLKDAQDIRDLLVSPQHCGYAEANVVLLPEEEATLAGLRHSLQELAKRTDSQSTVFLYLSCHGDRIEAGDHCGEYLLPIDVVYDSDATLALTALPGTEFTELLRAIPAQKIVVVFDCCHAAGLGQPKGKGPQRRNEGATLKSGLPETFYIEAVRTGVGRAILASCLAEEVSWILPGATNSLFTHHLLAALQGGIVSEDGLITITQVFKYVFPRVTAAEPSQHPLFKAELQNDIPVALYLGGVKGGPPPGADGFRYDAYISYVDVAPDSDWVWDQLLPRLEEAGIKTAISGQTEDPGVPRIEGIEQVVKEAKRTVVVLSPNYFKDRQAHFTDVLAQSMGVREGAYRLLPIVISPFEDAEAHLSILQLTSVDFTRPNRMDAAFIRLIESLKRPVPTF